MATSEFIDYYELLQISPKAELETVQRVYKMMALRYHPDNQETGDLAQFLLLNHAYETLADPRRREEYDFLHGTRRSEPLAPSKVFETKDFEGGVDGESNRRMGVLCYLYSRRRNNPDDPGLTAWELTETMSFAREDMVFAIWYLQEHNYIRQDDRNDYSITGHGVDFVEKKFPENRLIQQLLKAAEDGTYRTPGPKDAPANQQG